MKITDRALQVWRIRRALRWVRPGAHVLDVGCSDGALFRVAGDRIASGVGIDVLPADEWRGGPRAEQRTGAFPAGLRAGETFDAVTMLAVVEHVDEPELKEWAQRCAQVLRPGGRVIITVPSPAVDTILHVAMRLRLLDGMETHQHHGFDPSQVPDLFGATGFSVEAAERFQLGLNNLFVLTLA